jgi:hypothetical protein
MALIFNSISQFVIQPERTKRRVKRDDLDTLTEVWVGPSDQEDIFVPQVGHPHSDFSLMTVINTSIKRMPANVSEVTISYQGKLHGSGTDDYSSTPTASQYWSEGEVSYQAALSRMVLGPLGFVQESGIATYSQRYTGRCVAIAYITNVRPTGNPSNIGLATDYLGFTNIWQTMTGFQAGVTAAGGGSPISKITCTDVRIEDRAEGWYRVTETYQSRKFPGDVPIPAGEIATNTATGTSGADGLPVYSAALAAYQASQQAALGAALAANSSLPNSPLGSFGGHVGEQLGIDPQWGYVQYATPAAIAAVSKETVSGIAAGSQTLKY